MPPGILVLVIAVAAALAFGAYRAVTDGRFRGTHPVRDAETPPQTPTERAPASLLDGTEWADRLGERATLLQFSSAFCAPCRATRRILTDVAEVVPGVAHVEVDAEHHLDVVRRLGILRTPTTIFLDARGLEVTRAAGAPRKEQVLHALAAQSGGGGGPAHD
ncbi:thioredoxin family protein [Nocardioides sp. cx-173]|uniref:thioredoxin family protein n=1 Tax=Nocardioides sp. cx-173 TaxID=2898796 RepID=UPI001E2EB2E9|nr:thioredoxin family protein [Nocardioides sp. cx-173]MCD4526921.1 thioredoxin family protein [Nocardioides sp. cx-173]UGB41291.1 thioredoxin family protein [Nocardioides sp. cx-173]